MQVIIVPASSSGEPLQLFTSFLINGTVAVDAGSLGLYGDLEQQGRVRHILLTHAHLDHIASLPPYLDAVYDGSGDCVTLHSSADVLDTLRKDVFNNRLYPDFFHISTFRPPYVKHVEVKAGHAFDVMGLHVTPIEVNHVVPTMGYVIENDESIVVIPGDTGPTQAIWDVANRTSKPVSVFLECTFPDSMNWLAELAKHLTPELYQAEMGKVKAGSRFITVHIHPRHRPTVINELEARKLPNVEIGRFGVPYEL